MNFPGQYVTVTGANNGASEATRLGIQTGPNPDDSSFLAVPGLSDPTKVSISMAGGKYAGQYFTLASGQLSGGCASNYGNPSGDVYLTNGQGANAVGATWSTVSASLVSNAFSPNLCSVVGDWCL